MSDTNEETTVVNPAAILDNHLAFRSKENGKGEI